MTVAALIVAAGRDTRVGTALPKQYLAIFGTPNILFVRAAVKKWRGDHPDDVVSTLGPDMKMTFYVCMLIMLLLFSLLMITRYRMHRDARTAQAIRRRLGRLGGL